MNGTPWKPTVKESEGIDAEVRIRVPGQEEEIAPAPEGQERITMRRRFKIKQEDVTEHGPTMGCAGCANAIKRGRVPRPHNEDCRMRFERMFPERGDMRITRLTERLAEDAGTDRGRRRKG